jgi:vacuolar-type H+-ATPase subunit I/STV1
MEPKLYKYEIVGTNSLFRHNDEDKVEGDTIELSLQQAREFPGQLKSLEPGGDVSVKKTTTLLDSQDYQLSRDHEKLGFLNDRETELNKELDQIEAEKKTLEARVKSKAPAKTATAKEEKAKG